MNPFIAPLLTEIVINEMTCAGSILIVGVGLNLLKVTNIRIMNTVPGFSFRFYSVCFYNIQKGPDGKTIRALL